MCCSFVSGRPLPAGTALRKPEPFYSSGGNPAEDSCGRRIMDAAFPVTVQVSGPGVLKGLENGNLGDNTPYTSCSRACWKGRLIAYIQRTGSGTVTVKVSSEGLPEAQLSPEIPD